MKTSKPSLQTSTQEECGVWLDTVQLKGKAKQKRAPRPISKLLNPFTDGRGYSLSVALNFTQTKIEMPKTKQSALSTFFTAQRRVLNKMTTSEVPNTDHLQPSSSAASSTHALTAPTPVLSGTKRRREMDLEISDLHNSDPCVYHEWESENVAEPEASEWQEREASHTHSQNMDREYGDEQFEEINPPQSKRRVTAASSFPADSQLPPQAWSQDPLLTFSQYYDDECDQIHEKNTTGKNSEPSFPYSLQSEDAFGIQIDVEEPKSASPQKHIPVQLWKRADKEESPESQFKWTKPSTSLKKRAPQQSCREVDEDSLAMLFTQDSEGFRVIAHRGLQTRSPLKDQSNTNSGTGRTSAYTSLVEEEDEMLFTQDSQGNMVIKH
ncbi:Aurora kinase A and ninein-interacting protein [Dissostichus eleginoides]|uniref:Aurora kinase A and ninein-interacting protein n=1 Tax=Dissostichus eleginoides TaxID=100907 RepID=A0AAD9EWX0_DISEL|nr:Aurora kinase A and ninein-interacting protein [Dissostichus eleginoides]